MTFKKKIAVILVLALAASLPVFAANGDTLTIGGAVPLVLTLSITPNASADVINLIAGDNADATQEIADISIATNSAAGWELWVFSGNSDASNNSRLMNADDNAISYNITYTSDNALTGQADAAITNAGLKIVEDIAVQAASRTETGSLIVQYDQSTSYAAGYYSDLLTITLRAK